MSKLANDLREILSKPIDPTLFPQKEGNKINIGSYSIVCKKNMYTIKSYKTDEIIGETYSKAAAIALAKTLSKKKDYRKSILDLDKTIQKHAIDCMFYEHTMHVSKDETKQQVVQTRYDISCAKIADARNKLKTFIW